MTAQLNPDQRRKKTHGQIPQPTLMENEGWFRTLAETTSAAILIVIGQEIRYANLSAQMITGYMQEELLKMEFWQLAHPSYQSILKKYGVASQWGGVIGPNGFPIPARYELKLRTKIGKERWVDVTAGQLSIEGKPAWIVTAFDITERDLAEKELRKAKEELELRVKQRTAELDAANQRLREELEEGERAAQERERLLGEIHSQKQFAEKAAMEAERRANELDAIITGMVDAVVIYDAEGTILRANPAAIHSYGFDPAGEGLPELSRKLSARMLDGSPLKKEDRPSTRALRGLSVKNDTFLFTDANGKDMIIQASAYPLFEKGSLVGAVTVWHDVTQLETLLKENRNQRQVLETILETDPGGLAVLSGEDLIYQIINPAYRPILPDPNRDPIGLGYEEVWSPEESGDAADLMRYVLHTGNTLRLDHHIRRYPNGSQRTYSYHLHHMSWQGRPAVLTVLWETTALDEANQIVQQAAERSRILAYLSQAFVQAGLDQKAVLQTIAFELATTFNDTIVIRLLSDDGQWLVPVAYHSTTSEILASLRDIYQKRKERPNEGLAGQAFQNGQPLWLRNLSADQIKDRMRQDYWLLIEQFPVQDMLYIPLKVQEKILGVLGVVRFVPSKEFSLEDLNFLKEISERAALAIENARLYEVESQRALELEALHQELQRMAMTDTLTNCYNRRGFFEVGEREIERYHRFHHPLSAMMLDIDGFKSINDTYGHATGDQALQTLASVCQETIRQTDIIGRYGGDEFAFLLPESNLQDAGKLADRLHLALSKIAIDTPKGSISLRISIGVSEATMDMHNLSSLLNAADSALYKAKQSGRNRVQRA